METTTLSATTLLVKMAEMTVVKSTEKNPIRLKTTLGSCVGLILSDAKAGVHGLAHIMLPNQTGRDEVVGKYADTAIQALLDELKRKGCRKENVEAFLVGGARMFDSGAGIGDIGKRNVEETTRILGELGIPIVFDDAGGTAGRTIVFDGTTREVSVKTLKKLSYTKRS